MKNLRAVILPRLTVSPEGDPAAASLNDWFGGKDLRKQLVSVTLMSGTVIPKDYFRYMEKLETAVLPDTIETIEASAFYG